MSEDGVYKASDEWDAAKNRVRGIEAEDGGEEGKYRVYVCEGCGVAHSTKELVGGEKRWCNHCGDFTIWKCQASVSNPKPTAQDEGEERVKLEPCPSCSCTAFKCLNCDMQISFRNEADLQAKFAEKEKEFKQVCGNLNAESDAVSEAVAELTEKDKQIEELEGQVVSPCPEENKPPDALFAGRMIACEIRDRLEKAEAVVEAARKYIFGIATATHKLFCNQLENKSGTCNCGLSDIKTALSAYDKPQEQEEKI